MDENMRLMIKGAMPTLPDALAEEWIVPFVQEIGAPQSSGRWLNILGGYPLEFWCDTSWTLETINLRGVVAGKLDFDSNFTLTEMERGYFDGIRNDFSISMPHGKETTLQALEYLRTHRIFRGPPVLLCLPGGRFEIMDGNHRMLAYVLAMRAYPPEADEVQEVWLGRHDAQAA
jgi:hypothetical protein